MRSGRSSKRPQYRQRVYVVRSVQGRTVAQAWPSPRGQPKQPYMKAALDAFRVAQRGIKHWSPHEQEVMAAGLDEFMRKHRGVRGTAAIRMRDWLTMFTYGRAAKITIPGYDNTRTATQLRDASDWLDHAEPRLGSLLVRTGEAWLPTVQCQLGAVLCQWMPLPIGKPCPVASIPPADEAMGGYLDSTKAARAEPVPDDTPRLLENHPGAAFAWSMRQLSIDYTGPILRVRRSSDDQELDIPADVDGNLDTSTLAGHVGLYDGYVTAWYDQSGNARHATQPDKTQQPQIVSAGTIATEGLWPAIPGADRNILDSGFAGLTIKSLWAVANTIGTGPSSRILTGYSGSGAVNDDFVFFEQTGLLRYWDGGVQHTVDYNQGYHLHHARRGVNQLHIAVDGGHVVSGQAPNANPNPNTYKVLEEGGLDTDEVPTSVQEIIMYPDDRSAEKSGIENDINTYYAIY